MNRLKVGVYAAFAVAVALAPAVLVTTSFTPHALARADATLRAAEALALAQARELTQAALATAGQVVTVPAVQEVVGGQGDLQAAVTAAALGVAQPPSGRALLVATAAGGTTTQRLAGAEGPLAGAPRLAELLAGAAADGRPRQALLKAGDQLFAVGAVRAGPGAAVAVGLPVSLAALAPPRELGRVELYAHGWKVPGSPGPAAQATTAAALASPGRPVDAGRLGPLAILPAPCPSLPASFLRAPGHRALAVALPGVEGAAVVADVDLRPLLTPAAAVAWASLAGAALLLLFGLLAVWGVTDEQRALVPRALVNAADRIARGDFAARAPNLAGSMGTLSSALNRAAGAAQEARREAARAAPPLPTGAAPLAAVGAAADGEGPRGRAAEAAPAASPATAPDFFAPPEGHAPDPAAPAADPAPAGAAVAEPPPPPPPPPAAPRTEEVTSVTSSVTTSTPLPRREITDELTRPADGEDEDEAHWQAVFQDFLRVRGECGEPQAGVTYPRFREKLQHNRSQLMAKYACRTVRFQVYVKDGKAALKASPVR